MLEAPIRCQPDANVLRLRGMRDLQHDRILRGIDEPVFKRRRKCDAWLAFL